MPKGINKEIKHAHILKKSKDIKNIKDSKKENIKNIYKHIFRLCYM